MKLKLFYPQILAKVRSQLAPTQLSSWVDVGFALILTSLTATGLTFAWKQWGNLEALELAAYDRMVQARGDKLQDDRLLIVGITERDIEALQVTPPDQVLAEAIAILQQYNPRVIGLDLHRNTPHPPGWETLLAQMQAPNVITITSLGSSTTDAIPPPPSVSPDQVGFNDLPIDPDGVIRRNLLIGSNQDGVFFSFALRVALLYLASSGIQPQGSAQNPDVMQLGEAIFQPLTQQDGGYHWLDSNGYQILMDYRRSRAIAAQTSLSDILNRQFDPALVDDRIVLIGSTAPSLKDLFATPYSRAQQQDFQMAGVEIHAQLVSQILDTALGERPLFWFWPPWAEILWDLSWAMAGGVLGWCLRRPLTLGLGTAGVMSVLGGTAYLGFLNYGWIPVVSPVLALGISTSLMISYRGQRAQKQQAMVMTLLGQNTSPEIAAALWEGRDRLLKDGKLPGQRLTATMLFLDVKGFSTLAEKLSPEALLDWLNEYLDAMTEVVTAHGGIVNKFTGDGLLAVFGLPVPRTTPAAIAQDAQQAVMAGIAMGRRLEQLNQSWEQRGLATAAMRVGIFTGPVVAGSLGGKDRMEYGVIGDSVNIASRLESCLKQRQPDICRILIAQATLDHLGDGFQIEAWGNLHLKGKNHGIEVYRVVGHIPDCQPAP